MRRVLTSATALIVTVATLALSGCGGSTTGNLTFEDDAYPFSFSYPASWTLSRNVESQGADANAAQKAVSVALKEPFDQVTVSQFKLKKEVPAGETAFKPEVDRIVKQTVAQANGKASSAKAVEYGGAKGYQYTLTYAAGSERLQSRLTLLFKGGLETQVSCQSSADNRDALNAGCEQMLESLEID